LSALHHFSSPTAHADYDLTTPLYTFFINAREAGEAGFYVPQPKAIADLPIGVLSAIFLLLSGFDHLFVLQQGALCQPRPLPMDGICMCGLVSDACAR
jgi:hypothetical protein